MVIDSVGRKLRIEEVMNKLAAVESLLDGIGCLFLAVMASEKVKAHDSICCINRTTEAKVKLPALLEVSLSVILAVAKSTKWVVAASTCRKLLIIIPQLTYLVCVRELIVFLSSPPP